MRPHTPGEPLQKLVAEIMAAWRRAERLTQTLPEASPEREAVERTCERLRDAYQELTQSGVAEALTATEAKLLLRDAASDLLPESKVSTLGRTRGSTTAHTMQEGGRE